MPWKNGLCQCCASPGGYETCCLACCCPDIVYGLNVEKLARPHECSMGGSCVGAGVVWITLACSTGLCCIAQSIARANIREKNGIEGGCATDVCISACCGCCALIQEYNELHSVMTADEVRQTTNSMRGDR